MLAVEKEKLDKDVAWLQQQRQKLAQASTNLDQTFYQLGK
jgi:argininosuccinate lyase